MYLSGNIITTVRQVKQIVQQMACNWISLEIKKKHKYYLEF